MLFLAAGCTPDGQNDGRSGPQVVITATAPSGGLLEVFAVHVLKPEDGWLGLPDTSFATDTGRLAVHRPSEEPVILRVGAPNCRPAYTMLLPGRGWLELSATLASHRYHESPEPYVIGTFNDFDHRIGTVPLRERADGMWSADIEAEGDTIQYVIHNYASLGQNAGSSGRYVLNQEVRGPEAAFRREVVRNDERAPQRITFDPANLPMGRHSSIRITPASTRLSGVAEVYHRMADEMQDYYALRKGAQHDFTGYLASLDSLQAAYDDELVRHARLVAEAGFADEIGVSSRRAGEILEDIPPDSPAWLLHPSALYELVLIAGITEHVDYLQEVSRTGTYSALQADARYLLLGHYYENGDLAAANSEFFELVSRYPDSHRLASAYENFAPEGGARPGQKLRQETFRGLDGGASVDVYDIDADFLLVDFWATWCGPCLAALPTLHEIHDRFEDRSFSILSVDVNDDPRRVERLRREWPMPWYHVEIDDAERNRLGVVSLPYYVLLGPERQIIEILGSSTKQLEEILWDHLPPG